MKRHASLHALSQHHHFALIESLMIRRARQEPAARRAAAVRKTAGKFLKFWKKSGHIHFREEEEVLLPAYARHAALDRDADVMRMLAEHAAIRAKISDLDAALQRSDTSMEEILTALGQMLHDHVRLEENVIFPRMEKALREDELAAVGRQLTRLHARGSCDV